MVRKLILGATAAAAALALFAGHAQAVGTQQFSTERECEKTRAWYIKQGSRVSGKCEFIPNGSTFGGDAWRFYIYG
ncbi:hypothetical protein IU450_18525 [Nocardia abscessus]|uniref:hypothetical protein n=1 Tax=Nocardia abscessus TaxID=120957 RepID=UPI001894C0FF|nr:hypothetical protein [Nocardia abscessus]MBF6337877.1 hypothetical protein [Nocardia abscessus]